MFILKRDKCITIINKSIIIALSVWFICLFVFFCFVFCYVVLLQTNPTSLVHFYLFRCICCKSVITCLVLVSLNYPIRSIKRFSVLIGFGRSIVRERPFNLRGGVMVFCLVQNLFFGQHELEYFFLSRKVRIFLPEFNIRLYDKYS